MGNEEIERNAYHGRDLGLFVYGTFERFMESKEAKLIKGRFDMGPDIYQIWNLEGVRVHYTHNNSDTQGIVNVTLRGEQDKVDAIDRLIHEERKNHLRMRFAGEQERAQL